MATNICFCKWTDQGIRNAKDSTARLQAFRAQAADSGVRVKDAYYTLGKYDLVVMIEATSDEVLAKGLAQLGAAGNVRTTTCRAFTEAEAAQLLG